MRRSRVPYLQGRCGKYYFRFQIPARHRLIVGRSEIRLSLNTSDRSIAREQVARALLQVYSFKRLCRKCMELNPDEARRAMSYALNRLIEALQNLNEPWLSPQVQSGDAEEVALFESALSFRPDPQRARTMQAWIPGVDIDDDDLRNFSINTVVRNGGAALARTVLSTLGITADENSRLYVDLSVELAKVHVAIRRVLAARSKGDYSAEERFIDYYRNSGHITGADPRRVTPSLAEAWETYAAEKKNAKPKPAWSEKNARSQNATFLELLEIVGDIPVGQVSREALLSYRNVVALLPANRQKRYPGKKVSELLAMEIPTDQLPSSRTVSEKLIRVGAFLKWCRETKGYLSIDPMAGVQVEAQSQSYAVFTQDDLRRLFNSKEYERGKHRRSWQFWIPLIALYSGARQTEIAQLQVRDIVEEDGVWFFTITDSGEGQKVKTSAGVRKVPISSKLKAMGLLDYVAHLRQRNEIRLFPDLKKGPDGWGHKVSRWFGDVYRPSCGIEPDPTGKRKVFHSFRHTAITKALSKAVSLPHAQQVFGHEKSLLGETATYIAPFPVETLVPVIEALEYGLDHSAYECSWRKYVDGWFDSQSGGSSVARAA